MGVLAMVAKIVTDITCRHAKEISSNFDSFLNLVLFAQNRTRWIALCVYHQSKRPKVWKEKLEKGDGVNANRSKEI